MPLAAQRFEHYAQCVTRRVSARTIAFLDRCGNFWWSCGADLGADERLSDRWCASPARASPWQTSRLRT
jgi:hypothetical protein